MAQKFKVGETVLARPLKSPLYMPGEVTGFNEDKYTVKFPTGEVQKVASKFVMTAERRRGRSASKSPSRDIVMSPGRKTKKPGTPSKSPARRKAESSKKTPEKSPKTESKAAAKKDASTTSSSKGSEEKPGRGRATKKTATKEKKRSKSRSSSVTKKQSSQTKKKSSQTKKQNSPDPDIEIFVQKTVDEKLEMLESPKPEEFSQTESESDEVEFVVTAPTKQLKSIVDSKVTSVVEKTTGVYKRSSARLAAKAVSGGVNETATFSLIPEQRPVTTKKEQLYGGKYGALFYVPLSVALLFWVNIACQKASCSFLEKPRFPNNWIVTFFSKDYILAFFGFCVLQAVFSILPIGKRQKCGASIFRNNGLLAVVLTGGIVAALTYYKYPVLGKEKDIYTLMAISFVDAFVVSIILYVRGKKATASTINPRGNSGQLMYDWFVGRELNPMIGPVNIKQLAMRTSYLGWAVIVGTIMWRSYASADKLSWTLAFAGGSQLLYVALQLCRERNLGSSFVGKFDGVGYAFLWSFACYLPFTPVLVVRYIRSFKIQQTPVLLGIAAAVYMIGLFLSLAGKWLKTKFGKKASNQRYESLISRLGGKAKAVTFGFLRNGSYFGELFMVLGMSLPCGFEAVYPWVYMGTTTIALAHRWYLENRVR